MNETKNIEEMSDQEVEQLFKDIADDDFDDLFDEIAILKEGFNNISPDWPFNLIRAIWPCDRGLCANMDKDDACDAVANIFRHCSPRQEKVLKMLYMEGQTMEDVGRAFNITPARVRAIAATSIKKMRHSSNVIAALYLADKQWILDNGKDLIWFLAENPTREERAAELEDYKNNGDRVLSCRPLIYLRPFIAIREINTLERAGVHTVGALLEQTEESLKQIISKEERRAAVWQFVQTYKRK